MTNNKNNPLLTWLNKLSSKNKIILFVSIVAIITISVLLIIRIQKGTPVPVAEAKDRVTQQLQSLKLTGTVIHRKWTLNMIDENGKIFNTESHEIWEDNDSDKYKLIADYQDAKVTKSFDGQVEKEYDAKSKSLKITNYVFPAGVTSTAKRGYRTEVINWFNEILAGTQVSAVENTLNGKPVFVVTVIKNVDDKYVHYFDKESLALLTTKIYKVKNGKDVLYQENTDSLFELITPSSAEDAAKYFEFGVEVPSNATTTTKKIDAITRKTVE
jgi:hypothetical protein